MPSPPGAQPSSLARVRRLAHLLDTSIPLPFGVRVGWDAVLGLVPGLGDGVGTLLSAYIVVQAARLGAPSPLLLRMLGNVALEALAGVVPLVGDVFDAAWKANVRNVRLLEEHLAAPGPARASSSAWVVAVVLLLAGVVAVAVVLTVLVLRALGLGGAPQAGGPGG
jgi:hypothetical protein